MSQYLLASHYFKKSIFPSPFRLCSIYVSNSCFSVPSPNRPSIYCLLLCPCTYISPSSYHLSLSLLLSSVPVPNRVLLLCLSTYPRPASLSQHLPTSCPSVSGYRYYYTQACSSVHLPQSYSSVLFPTTYSSSVPVPTRVLHLCPNI
jgi:hypothetical protein